ncbi:MAG: hypothetical protein AAF828_00525 [Bacteroidota bacterium]
MKNLLYLALFAMIFVTACGDDDEGSGGAEGDLTITLTWDQADADLDLGLAAPGGVEISDGDAEHSGDILQGPGEESITFMNTAQDGTYTAVIVHFDGAGEVPYTLVIESANTTRTFNETISSNSFVDNFMFVKSGGTLTF